MRDLITDASKFLASLTCIAAFEQAFILFLIIRLSKNGRGQGLSPWSEEGRTGKQNCEEPELLLIDVLIVSINYLIN